MATKYVELTVVVEPDHGQYSAYCVELGTASCGDTLDEALANIKDAVVLHLNTLEELGERERFFKERRIRLKQRPTASKASFDLRPNALYTKLFEPICA